MVLPDHDGYDSLRRGFELSIDHRPSVVVEAGSPADVAAAVTVADRNHQGVAVIAGGHGPVVGGDGGVLINTRRMRTIRVDAERRTAWVDAGATWTEVLTRTAEFGLAPLIGSAPDVGAVGYTLGGGLGPLGRRFGFAADRLRAVDLVCADGELRRVDATTEPDLLWALRGGGGNFGVVTAMQIELVPLTHLYAGGLYFAGDACQEVLRTVWDCVHDASDDITFSVAVLTYPDLPAVPAPLRAQHTVHVRVAACAEPAIAERSLAPIRSAATPLVDTVRLLPITDVGTIHGDPSQARATRSRTVALRSVEPSTLEVLTRHSVPGARSMIEIRQLGGALAGAEHASAVGHRNAAATVYTTAYPFAVAQASTAVAQQALITDLEPWSDGGGLVNFLTGTQVTPADVRSAYAPADWTRLQGLKRKWDPANRFRYNNNIPPA